MSNTNSGHPPPSPDARPSVDAASDVKTAPRRRRAPKAPAKGAAKSKSQATLRRAAAPTLVTPLDAPPLAPRLVRVGADARPAALTDAHVDDLTRMLCDQDVDVAQAYFCALRDQGVAFDQLLCDLMTPAARRLGVLWEEDARDFIAVTLGMTRLHQLLHRLRPQLGHSAETSGTRGRVLIAPTPGETHVFGAAVAASLYERAGWDVRGGPAMTERALLNAVATERFDLLGLSIAREALLPAAAETIRRARAAACNRDMRILIGGYAIDSAPERARDIGADGPARAPTSACLEQRAAA